MDGGHRGKSAFGGSRATPGAGRPAGPTDVPPVRSTFLHMPTKGHLKTVSPDLSLLASRPALPARSTRPDLAGDSVSTLVDRPVEDGCLLRETGPAGRRAALPPLTGRAEARLHARRERRATPAARQIARPDDADRRALHTALQAPRALAAARAADPRRADHRPPPAPRTAAGSTSPPWRPRSRPGRRRGRDRRGLIFRIVVSTAVASLGERRPAYGPGVRPPPRGCRPKRSPLRSARRLTSPRRAPDALRGLLLGASARLAADFGALAVAAALGVTAASSLPGRPAVDAARGRDVRHAPGRPGGVRRPIVPAHGLISDQRG